jgi:SAM-dependent methyltransferase
MREFWDERAREDAFYFVDSRLEYGRPDLERFWAGGSEDLDRILAALGLDLDREAVVVEIGCGVGRLTRALAARARRVIALDVSEQMLRLAREHNPALENVDWQLGDGRSLSGVEDAVADACLSHVVFQHIPDPEVTLGYVREIGRVLRPGGWAAFQISNDPSVHDLAAHRSRRRRLADRALALAGRAPRGQGSPEWLGSAIELERLSAAAADGGMTIERVIGEGTQFCLVCARRDQT